MAKEKPVLSALDRAILQAMGQGKSFGLEDDPGAEKWPRLWEWLSRCYLGQDRIKQPATITLRLGPEGVIASLVDRDLCVSLDASCAHLADVFDALEAALSGAHPPIKSWGKREPHLRKRKLSD